MADEKKIKIDVPVLTIVKVALTAIVLVLIYRLSEIITLLFVVALLAAGYRPIVRKWEKKIGRPLAIIILFLMTLFVIAGFLYVVVPPFVTQTGQLINRLPDYVDRYANLKTHFPAIQNGLTSLTDNIGNITGSLLSFTASFFGGVVTFVTVLILTFYLLAEEAGFSRATALIIPAEKRAEIGEVTTKISQKVGDWIRGQFLLCAVMGILSYIGLLIIGLPYALTLAIISGVTEFIPIVGPIIAGFLAVIVALSTQSTISALAVVIFYVLLHQLEGNLLVPKVMGKAIGLPSSIIILAILIGGKLLGVMGAILAVPVCAVLYVLVEDWATIKKILNRE